MRRKKKRDAILTRDEIALDLHACKKAFDRVQVPWIIIDGIVLGYVREKNILAWDTDLDLGVFCEISSRKWLKLYAALRSVGFRIKNQKQDFVFGRRNSRFNLWFYHKKGGFYEAYPLVTPGIKFVEREIWFNESQFVEFLGSEYPMPNHLEDYLIHHYGSDWRVEKPSHRGWRKEKFGMPSGHFKPDIWLASRCGPKGDLWPKILKVE